MTRLVRSKLHNFRPLLSVNSTNWPVKNWITFKQSFSDGMLNPFHMEFVQNLPYWNTHSFYHKRYFIIVLICTVCVPFLSSTRIDLECHTRSFHTSTQSSRSPFSSSRISFLSSIFTDTTWVSFSVDSYLLEYFLPTYPHPFWWLGGNRWSVHIVDTKSSLE